MLSYISFKRCRGKCSERNSEEDQVKQGKYTVFVSQYLIHENDLRTENRECHKKLFLKNHFRIIGGKAVKSVIDHPWMVVLNYNTSDPNKMWGCGGSLINEKYVLSAAHCVKLNQINRVE